MLVTLVGLIPAAQPTNGVVILTIPMVLFHRVRKELLIMAAFFKSLFQNQAVNREVLHRDAQSASGSGPCLSPD